MNGQDHPQAYDGNIGLATPQPPTLQRCEEHAETLRMALISQCAHAQALLDIVVGPAPPQVEAKPDASVEATEGAVARLYLSLVMMETDLADLSVKLDRIGGALQ